MLGLGAAASSSPHSELFEYHRARLIISRVRLIAILFSVASLLWTGLNFAVFPAALATTLAAGLVLAGAIFALLAIECRCTPSAGHARLAISLLFILSAVVFIFSDQVLRSAHLDAVGHVAAAVYALLPLLLLAGLTLFPLLVPELLLCAIAVLLIFVAAYLTHADTTIPGFEDFPLFLLLLLIGVVAGISSLSQLQLLRAMLRQSLRDPLTRTLNRRSGELVLQLQLEQAKRTRRPLTVAFIDLDHFKQVNDTLGHEAGDMVLRGIADLLRTRLRASDVLIRWAGDEFLVLMPGASSDDASARLQTLTTGPWPPKISGRRITWSCGVAQWPLHSADSSWQALVAAADARMYSTRQHHQQPTVPA